MQARRNAMNRAFDRLVPHAYQHLASVHWTPVPVILQAAAQLSLQPHERVLDVGSGVGKVCIMGALVQAGHWHGVEQSQALVACARDLAAQLGVATRTSFWAGDALAIDWTDYHVIYLFNPFEQPLTGGVVDHAFDIAAHRAQAKLATLPAGTRVVVLNGFGAKMPSTYLLRYREWLPALGTELLIWQQSRPRVITAS